MRGMQRKIQDFVSLGQQSRDYMGSNESGAAGDEDFHCSCSFIAACPYE